MIDSQKTRGVTFLELLLAMGIMGVMALSVYQSVRYGAQVSRRVNNDVNRGIIKIMHYIGRDLRSSYLISEKHPLIHFSGTSSSLKFISVVPLGYNFDKRGEYDLKERRYFLQPGAKEGLVSLMYSSRDVIPPDSGRQTVEEQNVTRAQNLSPWVKSLEFAYFDGTQWKLSWDSQVQLPEAVRVSVEFHREGGPDSSDYFSTVVQIPGA